MNYYIQGNPKKADKIKAAFEAKGFECAWEDELGDVQYINVSVRKDGCAYVDPIMGGLHLLDILKTHPGYKELELPIEPCFKVGDKIEATIYGTKRRVTIREVDKTNLCYFGTLEECIGFSEQGQWHLASKPHYDIKNFHAGMPVLVRDNKWEEWRHTTFSHISSRFSKKFAAGCTYWRQCIPFEGNENLLGTTDPCDEQYINWQAIEL